MLNQRSDKVELLRIAEAVATEKSIDKEIILNSMELAIQKAAKIVKNTSFLAQKWVQKRKFSFFQKVG